MRNFFIKGLLLWMTLEPLAMLQGRTEVTPEDINTAQYQQELLEQVNAQENFVQSLMKEMARTDVVQTAAATARYENAVTMLDVKRTLVSNFIGAPSLRSPLIRAKLMSILKQELITPSDLAQLQSLVTQEKARMQSEEVQRQQTQQPSTPGTPKQPGSVERQ